MTIISLSDHINKLLKQISDLKGKPLLASYESILEASIVQAEGKTLLKNIELVESSTRRTNGPFATIRESVLCSLEKCLKEFNKSDSAFRSV